MRNLRITLSGLAALYIMILAALLTGQTASAATPFKSGVYSYEDIGETGTVSVAFNDKGEIWFSAFVINEDGHYAPGGYVFNNNSRFIEHYSGRDDIPPEHRIFAYPKLNIREQMAAYQEIIDRSALNEDKQRLPISREDR